MSSIKSLAGTPLVTTPNVLARRQLPALTASGSIRIVESELHDHEGTTESLSARWMPLAEFTPLALAALTDEPRADGEGVEAPIGNVNDWYGKWENGKMGFVNMMAKGRPTKV
ncbi:hypothetical protein FIBSPDRAFT_924397 [Athelia psychrophila]|uniref:Uncharacterized protein n=1 Tax=Athelia psychrophila TaxID=1759441 RepID=A0A166WU96_9AGAM|nr:hypothetical protein FIBSPDRAFT_924397 [Fibularhizoctonia sp. CBS 109695]